MADATGASRGRSEVVTGMFRDRESAERAYNTLAERGGVRVESRVEEVPVEQDVQLREERVHVERRPVDRPVTDADAAFREGSIEVTERAEEAVVAKEARVVEEVVVNKEVGERTETVRDTIRRTDVDVRETDERR